MVSLIIRSIKATLILAVILCGIYPLAVMLVGKVLFPSKVDGGILYNAQGHAVGAKLIGQNFSRPEYFHGRPSAAGQNGYDATSSGGTNLGPTSQKLIKAVQDNVKKAQTENAVSAPVPVDLVTSSGSGLDPHISPEGAEFQVERVAKARRMAASAVRELVQQHTKDRDLKFFGEPVVNVLELNLALDATSPMHH